jgi:clan AA aspartic protease (TIGR02281 family)
MRCLPRLLRPLSLLLLLATAMTISAIAQEKPKAAKPSDLPEEITKALEANGLRIIGTGLALDLEGEVTKAVRDLAKSKKSLMLADRERYAADAEVDVIKQRVSDLKKRHTLLSAQLANVTDVATNNRLVGELNTAVGLIDALGEQREKSDEKAKAARSKATEIRDEFVVTLLKLRETADAVTRKWESLAADKELAAAVESAAAATGKKLALKPSPSFVNAERQLKTYEEAVISETIKLDNEGGSLLVDVAINDKPPQKMVLDSGATSISVSTALAKQLGIEPKASDPDIVVSLADGREIPAKRTIAPTVRVGKFTADNVECVVLGEEARNAPPLLGMSFLGRFKFEVDATRNELKMVKVDSGEPDPTATKSKKKKTK